MKRLVERVQLFVALVASGGKPDVERQNAGGLDAEVAIVNEAGLSSYANSEIGRAELGAVPVIDEAITLEVSHNNRSGHHAIFAPTVHADRCTGCGKCEQSCVLPEAAIKVLPSRLARAEAAEHYRKGWEEKEAKGAPVVEGIIDLPDRLPGPGTDNLVAPGGFEPSFKLPEVTQ